MSLTFDAATHTYALDEAPVRSVTELLRTVGLVNFSDVPPAALTAAQHRGTVVHQAIHYYNENDLDVDAFYTEFPEYKGYLASWLAVVASGRLKTVLCEHRVANESPRYAGTIDWLGWLDGKAALLDFATGRPEDSAKQLQTAAYAMAAASWAMRQPEETALRAFIQSQAYLQRYSVRLDAKGGWPTLTHYQDPRDFRDFRLLAETVNLVAAHKRAPAPWSWRDDAAA